MLKVGQNLAAILSMKLLLLIFFFEFVSALNIIKSKRPCSGPARMFLVLTLLNAETANLIADANLILKLVPRREKQRRKLDRRMPKRHAVKKNFRAITMRYK